MQKHSNRQRYSYKKSCGGAESTTKINNNITLLAIECAGGSVSACLYKNQVWSTQYAHIAYGQAQHILPMIASTLKCSHIKRNHIEAVAVSVGPGFFTGMRIGLATAQGLGLGLGIPVYGATTTESFVHQVDVSGATLVVMETRCEDFYIQLFDGKKAIKPIERLSFESIVRKFLYTNNKESLFIIGSGSYRLQRLIQKHCSATKDVARGHTFVTIWPYLRAESVAKCVAHKRSKGESLLTNLEPLYIKAPNVTTVNKIEKRC